MVNHILLLQDPWNGYQNLNNTTNKLGVAVKSATPDIAVIEIDREEDPNANI